MADQTTNGHDKKPHGKWSDPMYRREYQKKWREKKRREIKAAAKPTKRKFKRKSVKKHGRYEDAIIYLRHAVARMQGEETMSMLLTKLALKTLEEG